MRIIFAVLALGFSTSARADPCEGVLPSKGKEFSGEVRYIVDGDGFCVGSSADPTTWIEVRAADFYAPELREPGGLEAKAVMARIAMGNRAQCVAGHRSFDRVVASCSIGGQSIRRLMLDAGVKEGGNGKRR